MTRRWLIFIFLISFSPYLQAEDVIGFWKTINDETKKPESVVGIYEYQGKYYGRIILTYNDNGTVNDSIYAPKEHAPGVIGEPFYVGLDIIWDMQKNDSKYSGGRILDPEKGKIYHAEMWPEKGNLIVRGEVWVFGENEEWLPAKDSDFPAGFKKPDLHSLVPKIPEVKRVVHHHH